MVLDTSALLAVLQDEPEREAFIAALDRAPSLSLSTASFLETSMVIDARYGAEGLRDLDLLLSKAEVELVPVDAQQAHIARRAFHDYGKGRHAAGLNFGDCFAYALARASGEPLLFKGEDFPRTDIASAMANDSEPPLT